MRANGVADLLREACSNLLDTTFHNTKIEGQMRLVRHESVTQGESRQPLLS